jgi:elongation factor 2
LTNTPHTKHFLLLGKNSGKSTLTDSLIQKAGIISAAQAGRARYMDTRDDEAARGITIKSTGISMFFKYDASKYNTTEQQKSIEELEEELAEKTDAPVSDDLLASDMNYMINLIDSPGHVDFSSEVTAALRITDGAIVVVDCIEGVCVQTETVLRQAMAEKVVPVLMVNKVDRAFLELQMDGEEAYQNFRKAVESVNVVISPFEAEDPVKDRENGGPGRLQVDPSVGNVAFGSGLQQWAFTLKRFSTLYASKFGVNIQDMMKKLWGDNFLDTEKKVWKMGTPDRHIADGLRRAFVQFCLDPIQQLFEAVMSEKTKKVEKMLKSLGVVLKGADLQLTGKNLLKRIMTKWLPAADALLEMVVIHLPSPQRAQRYRCAVLYDGPLDDTAAQAIMKCDKHGPLMMYISKMIPTPDQSRFFAFGRVFSGTVATGQQVRILGPNYEPGKKTDLNIKSIQRTLIMMGRTVEQVNDIPAGNNVALVGVDQYLIKTGTITTIEDAYCFKTMKYSVSPVVRVAVDVKNPADLPKLVEGLKRLSKSDPLVVCTSEESGEHIIAGAGELHLEICLKDLQDDFMQGAPITISEPVVSYRETCTDESSIVALSKSPNNHNRLFCKARPLPEGVPEAIDKDEISAKEDFKIRARKLADDFGMDVTEARKIWAFGPEQAGPNICLDATKGVAYLNEIKDHFNSGFQWATKEGPMTEEQMRGVCVRLLDVTLHADSIHRGAGQILPAARRVCYASVLLAKPNLMEPIFLADVSTEQQYVGSIYGIISQKRGTVIAENQLPGSPIVIVKCHVPVAESFGLTATLRAATAGKAFPQCTFSHWGMCQGGDALEAGTKTNALCLGIRTRKGLDMKEIPDVNRYYDKL